MPNQFPVYLNDNLASTIVELKKRNINISMAFREGLGMWIEAQGNLDNISEKYFRTIDLNEQKNEDRAIRGDILYAQQNLDEQLELIESSGEDEGTKRYLRARAHYRKWKGRKTTLKRIRGEKIVGGKIVKGKAKKTYNCETCIASSCVGSYNEEAAKRIKEKGECEGKIKRERMKTK